MTEPSFYATEKLYDPNFGWKTPVQCFNENQAEEWRTMKICST